MGAGASTIDAPNWGFSASELKTVVGKERFLPLRDALQASIFKSFLACVLKTTRNRLVIIRWDPEEFAKLPKNSDGNITNKTWKRLCEKEEVINPQICCDNVFCKNMVLMGLSPATCIHCRCG